MQSNRSEKLRGEFLSSWKRRAADSVLFTAPPSGNIRCRNDLKWFIETRAVGPTRPYLASPESFVIPKEEWYTYDRSPGPNVHVLASVDESTYAPASAVRMGDHPVVWTNDRMAARNVVRNWPPSSCVRSSNHDPISEAVSLNPYQVCG